MVVFSRSLNINVRYRPEYNSKTRDVNAMMPRRVVSASHLETLDAMLHCIPVKAAIVIRGMDKKEL